MTDCPNDFFFTLMSVIILSEKSRQQHSDTRTLELQMLISPWPQTTLRFEINHVQTRSFLLHFQVLFVFFFKINRNFTICVWPCILFGESLTTEVQPSFSLFVYLSFSANDLWPFSMQIITFWLSWNQTVPPTLLWWRKCECMKNSLQKISIKMLATLTKVHSAIHSIFLSTYATVSPPPPLSLGDIPTPQALNHCSMTAILLTLSNPS